MKDQEFKLEARFHPCNNFHLQPYQINCYYCECDYELPVIPSQVIGKVNQRLIPLLFTIYILSSINKAIVGILPITVTSATFPSVNIVIPTATNNTIYIYTPALLMPTASGTIPN